jgi:hypothetical protein
VSKLSFEKLISTLNLDTTEIGLSGTNVIQYADPAVQNAWEIYQNREVQYRQGLIVAAAMLSLSGYPEIKSKVELYLDEIPNINIDTIDFVVETLAS